MIEIDRDTLRDFERASRLEWLETDGLGGWAGSTLSGAHTRRDHHLLRLPASATAAPSGSGTAATEAGADGDSTSEATSGAGSTVALAKLDELVIEGGRVHELSCNRFPFFVAAPGVRCLAGFRRDLFPVFEHEAGGVRLQKTIAMLGGERTLLVVYEVLAAPGPFVLALRPFFASRRQHALCRADAHGAAPAVARGPAGLCLRWSAGTELFLAAATELDPRPDWWYRFELEEERLRGVDFQEDLWTPGLLRRELEAGDRFGVVASARDAADRDALELLANERRRRQKLLDRLPVQDDLTRILAVAADQFPLRRPGGGRTLAAGYPGGEETLADGLIALPGVLLATGRAGEARRVLRSCARAAAAGALPDRFPGSGAAPTYDAPDASLWLFSATWRYLLATGDEALVRDTLRPALARIATAHERGAASGLRAAADGLLEAAPGSAFAARRPGKAVEINALWHNALATLAELDRRLGDPARAKAWGERARRVQRRFAELFWNAAEGCLYDSAPGEGGETAAATGDAGKAGTRRAGPHVAGGDHRDPTLRAHQVLAIGLPFPALSKQRAQRLLRTLEERLVTPVGLRDLATSTHDLAWPWLLGSLLAAQVWLRGATGRRQALQAMAELDPLLSEDVIGTVAELAGAEPPYPRAGHAAHAASVGELLRVYVDDLRPVKRPPAPKPRRPRRTL
jgi:predicted glycogen debranching enzyme